MGAEAADKPASADDRSTQRMSAEQFRQLFREAQRDTVDQAPPVDPRTRATTVDDAETTQRLAEQMREEPPAATLPITRPAARAAFAFDTSDEPEGAPAAPLPSPEVNAAIATSSAPTPVAAPRAGRAPLSTMELSPDMILQIAVNQPLAVPRPNMATMELTPDMILPERFRAAPAAPRPTPSPPSAGSQVPTIIVEEADMGSAPTELSPPSPTALAAPAAEASSTGAPSRIGFLARARDEIAKAWRSPSQISVGMKISIATLAFAVFVSLLLR
jgi:hypothetical protein